MKLRRMIQDDPGRDPGVELRRMIQDDPSGPDDPFDPTSAQDDPPSIDLGGDSGWIL